MSGLTADQIIQRIANANGLEPVEIRDRIKQTLWTIIANTTQHRSVSLADLSNGGEFPFDQFVVILEHELYKMMMPKIPGWEWDGDGYRNIRLLGEKK